MNVNNRKYKKGDIGADGRIFRTYAKNRSGNIVECWCSPEAWEKLKERDSLRGSLYAEKAKERVKQWELNNPEKRKEQCRKWNATSTAKKAKAKWNKSNPEKKLELTRAYQAKKKEAIPSWFSDFDKFVMQEAYDLAKTREDQTGVKWHVDHIYPLSSDVVCGLHLATNIQVIPARVNLVKSNKVEL